MDPKKPTPPPEGANARETALGGGGLAIAPGDLEILAQGGNCHVGGRMDGKAVMSGLVAAFLKNFTKQGGLGSSPW